jgi:hypothetical protein
LCSMSVCSHQLLCCAVLCCAHGAAITWANVAFGFLAKGLNAGLLLGTPYPLRIWGMVAVMSIGTSTCLPTVAPVKSSAIVS